MAKASVELKIEATHQPGHTTMFSWQGRRFPVANLSWGIRLYLSWFHLPSSGGSKFTPFFHKAVANHNTQRGLSLIEILVALGIFGLIVPAFLLAINTTYRANQINDEKVQAEAVARTQLDTILGMTYNTDSGCYPAACYPVTGTLPGQYDVVITTQPIDTPTCAADLNCNTLQLVTASVSRPTGGGASKLILSVSAYKGKR